VIEVEELPAERLAEWRDVRNRINADDPVDLDFLLHRRERHPGHRDLFATVDGVAAGVGTYSRMIDDPVSPIGQINFRVLPEHRRRGVATALHRAVSEIGRAHFDGELEGKVIAPTAQTEAYVAARGYRRVQRMIESRFDLREAPVREGTVGPEMRSVAEDPRLLEAAYAVALESEPDVPNPNPWVEPASFEEWRAREIDDALFVAEGSLVAFVDGEPVAYGLMQLERPGLGAHHATGVARAHRGRGLATALKRAQIERARAAGLHGLVTWNEEGNAAIRAVNARLGYRITRDVVTYRGPLLGDA
jgi:RimJ/RimL family protein N-acetyltransferase